MDLFITGTDTGVGKTFITAGIAATLDSQGVATGVYKPAQSGASMGADKKRIADDLEFVKKLSPKIKTKASYILEIPAAPSVAADVEDITIDKEVIKKDFNEFKKGNDVTIVEGAGGLMVPFGKDFMCSDIAKMLNLPVLIVAKPDLGTINHTLLSIEYARKKGLKIAGVVVNNYPEGTTDVAIKTAPLLIQKFGQLDKVWVVPKNQNPFGTGIAELVAQNISINRLFS